MKKTLTLLLLIGTIVMTTACGRQKKTIQYVRVPVDSAAMHSIDTIDDRQSWEDEPAIMIPDEMMPGAEEVTESDLEVYY